VNLALKYFILCFCLCAGILQAVFAGNNFRGALFFQSRAMSYIFAFILMLPPFLQFFSWNKYNQVGIIQGAQQAGLFSLAALAAIIFCLSLSSVINHRRFQNAVVSKGGIEALSSKTFFQLINSEK